MSGLSRKFKKLFTGLFLLLLMAPALWAIGKTLSSALSNVWTGQRWAVWPYLAGIAVYLFIERLAEMPLKLYVVGHELTHALSCILSGGRVFDFHASEKGGHVKLSKTNSWIALSPYCVPLYTLVLLLLFRVLGVWWDLAPYRVLLEALIGMSLAFHVSLTVYALHCHQPDLELLGWLPSIGVILFANGFCLAALLAVLFPAAISPAVLTKSFGSEFVGAGLHMARGAGLLLQKMRSA